ncbi:MAG: FAD-binding protein [Bryobacteraceae bacterium]|nr:FAD-binding protein [Bryobacteraceae bacterium]
MSLVQIQVDAQTLRRELEKVIEGDVRFDTMSRSLYSTDASVYRIQPIGLVIPKYRQDIVRALEVCARFRCPVTMRGGGTAQAGQAIGEGLQIDISKHYNRVLEVNAEERWVRVEPGIVLDELNAKLAPLGLRFAPDISTANRATIGGMIANNSSGARSVLYGITLHHVEELTVALADGTVVTMGERNELPEGDTLEAKAYRQVVTLARTHADEIARRYPKILRRVGGYNLDEFTDPTKPINLAKIMVGSEGTLGVILEAKLRLVPLPKAKALLVIEFATLLEALSATPVILTHQPAAIEVMDKAILDNTRQNAALEKIRASIITGDPGATLCVEFYGDRAEDLPPRLEALAADLRGRNLGYRYHPETLPARQARVWSLREAALGLSMAVKEDAKSISFVEDTAVAPEKLSEFIGRFLDLLHRHETTAGIYAHASVGCLHVRPVVNMKTAEGVRKFEAIANDVAELVLEFGGALSGEHGDGLVRSPFMRKMFGPVLYEAFREIKRTFDPHNILNPGKIVDAPPLTANLRFGPSYRTANPTTWFDYSDYGGFAGAVEMCSGVGACRKTLSGNMCPSYMVTREEADSTRGRANALRMAMSGDVEATGQDLYKVLELCLECRACKSECPVGVDMSRYKSEFLASYWKEHGTPLRARLLGHANRLAQFGSILPSVTNATMGLLRSVAGVHPDRALPKLSGRTLESWFRQQPPVAKPHLLLFKDTWTNYYQPEIGRAAIRVLTAAGQTTGLAPNVCCGRPLISQGLLSDARDLAEQNTRHLLTAARAGQKLVFCEPSCLSAVQEDAPGLLRGELRAQAEEVAQACVLFEDHLEKLLTQGEAKLELKPGPAEILLHGHCHQKAMGLLESAKSLLARVPGAKVIDPDAGCCGMAGSFGYAKEKYEVSRRIAERKLLPAVANRLKGTPVVAAGFSCRHQVQDFADATAVHPAVFLESLL